ADLLNQTLSAVPSADRVEIRAVADRSTDQALRQSFERLGPNEVNAPARRTRRAEVTRTPRHSCGVAYQSDSSNVCSYARRIKLHIHERLSNHESPLRIPNQNDRTITAFVHPRVK